MTAALPRPRRGTAGFPGTEPVLQSHPLLEGAATRMPLFGDTGEWDFNGVVRRPARLPPCGWKLRFNHALATPAWNLLARETMIIMANPRHPVVLAAGLSLKARPTARSPSHTRSRICARSRPGATATACLSTWPTGTWPT